MCVSEGRQPRSLLIDKAPVDCRVISSAWGVPRATSTISHLRLTVYPSDNHPDPSTVAETVWGPSRRPGSPSATFEMGAYEILGHITDPRSAWILTEKQCIPLQLYSS